MTTPAARSAEIAALADGIRATGAVRIRLDDLWPLWAGAAPRLVGDPTQVPALAHALEVLRADGVVELPTTSWDTSTKPPLPRWIAVPAARRTPRHRGWIRFPWRPELGWVASLPTLSDTRLRDLIAINDWLTRTDGGRAPVVPMRYRSAELFGDEKRLDRMARTNLFGPGRLSLQMLACVRRPAPLPAVVVGQGPDVLVVENSDTYWVAVDALTKRCDHPIGAVAWGCGNAFPSQVGALGVDVAGRGPVIGRVWYWGDLDPTGVAIASEAATAAAKANAPPILPAAGLWAALADQPVQDQNQIDWTGTSGHLWLGPELWQRFAHVRDANGRVAQEAVPPRAIDAWASTLDQPQALR